MAVEPSLQTQHTAAELETLLESVSSAVHLERENALRGFEELFKSFHGEEEIELGLRLQAATEQLFRGERWEERLGGLKLAVLLVKYNLIGGGSYCQNLCDVFCKLLLEDSEVRVRWAVGELLGELCSSEHVFQVDGKESGCVVWELTGEYVLDSIQRNYNRDDTSEASGTLVGSSEAIDYSNPVASLLQQSYKVVKPGEGEMRHDTEGWKCLETSFRALDHIMKGYGEFFRPYLDDHILKLIFKSLKHPNRFIREVCQFILGTVCEMLSEEEIFERHVDLASKIGFGLSDNWSQVRYAASVAVRKFIVATPNFKDDIIPLIIPHLCLNRYYIAEGVRIYSQETWRIAVGDSGRQWVARCIQNIVSYYVEQSKANNHAVREASCACIAELMTKVDADAVAPHVPRLLSCLLTCFRDASWPVRDAACLATGRCVLSFPEESKEILEKLYKLWFAHLEENIYSVREDSAIALGNAARAYGDEAIKRITEKLNEMLPRAKQQKPDSKSLSRLENTTTFGVAAGKANRANDKDLHTDQLMFSCGSLAPKLKRGSDCCGDYGMTRPAEPWEASDGSIYMLRELAGVSAEAVVPYMTELADLARLTHFTHYVTLHETLWRCLPSIAQALGKKEFKKYLDQFLDPLFRDAQSDNKLCEAAAVECIQKIQGFVGRGIFTGRLTNFQTEIYDTLFGMAFN